MSLNEFEQDNKSNPRTQRFDRISSIDLSGAPEVLQGPSGGFDENPGPKRRKLWVIPCAVGGALAAVYLGGVFVFSSHYLPNTVVDGTNVSLKTRSDLAAAIESQTADYNVTIQGDGIELSLTAADIDLGYDGESCADEVFSRTSAWAWPLDIASSRTIKLEKKLSYSKEKIAAALAPFVEQSKQAAEEAAKKASLTYDAAKASFVLNEGGDTRSLDAEKACEAIYAALDTLQVNVTLGDECLNAGDDFSQALAQANSYLAAAPTLTLAGSTVCQITPEQISSWVKIADDLQVTIDGDAVTTWCRGDLSKACDTVGTTRTYTRPDGKSVSVSGGTYGWNIDGATTAENIIEALESGQKANLEIPTLQSAASFTGAAGGKDWGNRYIDVDLTEQHARMYDASGNLIWETDIVSGDTTQSHDTPYGIYVMDEYRASGDVELRGTIDASTGEPEYISHVSYWMPFIGNSYALHDADWRSKFGGTIYQGNGSHGCVNLPVDKAAELFNLTAIGDVVVVHA